MAILFYFPLLLLLLSCGEGPDPHAHLPPGAHPIQRLHNEYAYQLPPFEEEPIPPYPWEKEKTGKHPIITKEYFRCRGSGLNPVRVVREGEEVRHLDDCGGPESHSLPLREDKEFVYPILVDLMNYLQKKTGNKVVITCGHRCPFHNAYADPSKENQFSKHQIGAAVSFYVQGMEQQPQKIVDLLMQYYQSPAYNGQSNFQEFQRYEKSDTNVAIQPWYNKEIYIKLFQPNEGRDLDNRHPYPYIQVQVRWDRETKERVLYSWKEANYNYRRG